MNEPGPSAATMPAQASYDSLQRRIVFAAVAFALALLAVQAFQAWNGYRTAQTEAERRAANLVYILSAHMQEAVAALDASLVQITAASARLGGPSGDAGDWNAVLTGAIAGLPNTGSLTVTDSEGVVRHSTVANILGQSRQGLYVFQTLRRQANAGMVADRPFKSLGNGEMLIPLGRRLEGPAGTFQGIAVATLRLPQLREFYSSIDVGPGGQIRILHPDGQVLFREPSSRDPIGEPALEDPVYRAYQAGKADGLLDEVSGPNGRSLITAFHALPSPGLLLAVSLDRGAAAAEWRNNLAVDGGLLAAEILVLAIVTATILQLLRARHAATLRLASRERQLLLAESIAHMGAVTFDVATATVRTSPQIAAIFGWPEPVEEIPLQAFLAAVHEADRQSLGQTIARCAEGGGPYRQEFRITRPDGSARIIWSEGFQDGGPRTAAAGVVAICQDVTDRRMAERQLAQALKMEGVGQLTGGVAHDFNNLLTVIIGNLDMLAEWPGADARARETAELALRAADRGADLVRSLLAFSRKQPLQPRVVNLNEIVLETDHLLRRTLGEQVELETSPERKIWLTMVDPAQLQAALNSRVVIEQANGVVAERAQLRMDEAFTRPKEQPVPVRRCPAPTLPGTSWLATLSLTRQS